MLQVMSVVVVAGLSSLVPRRSDADFGGSYLGQDVILIIVVVISHCVA